MKYALLVAWREFSENAKTRGFWIGICIFPIILFISIQVPILLETKGTPTRYFVMADPSGQFQPIVDETLEKAHQRRVLEALNEYANKYRRAEAAGAPATNAPSASTIQPGRRAFPNEFAEQNSRSAEVFLSKGGKEVYLRELKPFLSSNAPPFVEPRRLFRRVELPAGLRTNMPLNTLAQELKPYLSGTHKVMIDGQSVGLYASILIPADIEQQIVRPAGGPATSSSTPVGIQYWSANLADMRLRDDVERSINGEIRKREYTRRGLDTEIIRQVERTFAPMVNLNPKKEIGKEAVGVADMIKQWAPTAFVYLLWVAIFSIAQMLLNNTIEEKSNRIIEVLLSSVTPGELMMGKLAGIAAVGLTMIGAWILAMVGIVLWKSGGSSVALAGPALTILRTTNLLPAFAVYFLLGFIMYAGIILAIGSICNTIKEAQNYMAFITMLMMVPLLTMMFIPKDPNGTLATVLSWIPFYTPFIMMNRITADPPWVDLVGTTILLLLTTALILWLSVKIFRIGILRTGQPPKIVELIRWLRG